MRIRIQDRGTIRLVRWAERAAILAAFLCFGYWAWVYFETRVYQAGQMRRLAEPSAASENPAFDRAPLEAAEPRTPVVEGTALSRMEIPRLGLSVVVVEGVEPRDLRLAVGHVPGTALPGETGNIGIAGHRDTFFRPLADVRGNDIIWLTSGGTSYEYAVERVEIVNPSDVQVLDPSSEPELTLVTCYPFYYVGPAPQRYVVRARQVAIRRSGF